MALWSCGTLFLYMLVSIQLVHGSADTSFEPNKCHCSPPVAPSVPDIGSPIGGSYSPPDGGISSPSIPGSPPSYSPPEEGGNTPPIISTPPSPIVSSTPPLTPPYSTTPPSPSTTPSTPAYGSSSPPTPTTPSYGTPSSPTTPSTPDYTPPSTGGAPLPTPSTPDYGVPTVASPPPDYSVPSTPDGAGSVPPLPDLSPPDVGSTPVIGDPGSSTGTCNFWGSHPDYLPSILSFFSTISDLFGGGFSPVFRADMTLQEALTNTRRDGYGSLLREGSASLLNSLVNKNFVLSTQEVKQKFNAALSSNHAAAVQATKFKSANEGHLSP